MNKIELLAPAGSHEAAIAAVQNGANAIYLGFGDFNARRNAKNFSVEEMSEIVSYCRARDVKTNITLNTLLTDREFPALCKCADALNAIAPDAIIVADLGVARALKKLSPQIALHASTQLTVHNVDGAKFAKELGFSRVVLSRELPEAAIAQITKEVDIETEVFVHGALCMCYSGQCYMSGVIGKRSGNRGLCAQPCRLPYRVNSSKKDTYPLSLRDLCLAGELSHLVELGVSSLKIEGRMKRPEYVAIVCKIYSRLLKENRKPTDDELAQLAQIFSRDGFTDGYYKNKHGLGMFGTRGDEPGADAAIYKEAQRSYASENVQIPLAFSCNIALNKPISLTVSDDIGNTYTAVGVIAEAAKNRPLDESIVREKLSKTGGTPFFCDTLDIALEENCSVPISALNALRRECLDALYSMRAAAPKLKSGKLDALSPIPQPNAKPKVAVSLLFAHQICDDLLKLPIDRFYFPVHQLDSFKKFIGRANFGITLPQIIWDEEWDGVLSLLKKAKDIGISNVLVSNVGQIAPLQKLGFTVEGDFNLNAFNSHTIDSLSNMLTSITLSPELKLSQIRDLRKPVDCEIIAYGRLPLMISENCAIKGNGTCPGHGVHSLTDRRGITFPVMCMPHHRNQIFNSEPIYLADKLQDVLNIGLSRLRLLFTTEDAAEVLDLVRAYQSGSNSTPKSFTRGLYMRGVE